MIHWQCVPQNKRRRQRILHWTSYRANKTRISKKKVSIEFGKSDVANATRKVKKKKTIGRRVEGEWNFSFAFQIDFGLINFCLVSEHMWFDQLRRGLVEYVSRNSDENLFPTFFFFFFRCRLGMRNDISIVGRMLFNCYLVSYHRASRLRSIQFYIACPFIFFVSI